MPKHMLPFHDHPLSLTKAQFSSCSFCIDPSPTAASVYYLEENCYTSLHRSTSVYHCMECSLVLHKKCVESFQNYPSPCSHSFKIFMPNISPHDYANAQCHFCQSELSLACARCTICNISMDPSCLQKLPPETIFKPNHHKHSLTLLVRLVTFTCNACGVEGDRNPYVCLKCNLMLHRECLNLPRVIIINRHDHRISHTFHLGQRQGDWECGVCRKKIDWVYGAFKCSRCPSYAVHSRCATKKEVWDGIELKDVPEKEEEIEDPLKVINEKDIIHFSHEKHILRLGENSVMNMRCGGCILPINGNPCYNCVECDFSLHKACASHPRKKRHLLHNHKLTLLADTDDVSVIKCTACGKYSNGFRYQCHHEEDCKGNIKYDVRCSSVAEPFHHDLHPHPLYWTLEGSKRCQACGTKIDYPLCCTVCDEYALCMRCVTLPRKVKHRCDDHFLSLCQGVGNASGDLWCDICETKTDPNVCYYTCEECGVSLHIDCVLGDLHYMKVGHVYPGLEVLPNNGVTRPLCSSCEVRCKFQFLMKHTAGETVRYFCSIGCIPRAKKL